MRVGQGSGLDPVLYDKWTCSRGEFGEDNQESIQICNNYGDDRYSAHAEKSAFTYRPYFAPSESDSRLRKRTASSTLLSVRRVEIWDLPVFNTHGT